MLTRPTPGSWEIFWANLVSARSSILRQGHRIRGQGQGQDRGVGRIYLAVDRRGREVRRQVAERGVDGSLDLLLRHVEGELQGELEGDDRASVGARRGHQGEARHLAELPLQRRRDRRGHHIGTAPGVERPDLDGRVIDLRQRGYGQLLVSGEAGQKNGNHEQRRRHRPDDEGPGEVQEPLRFPLPAPWPFNSTFVPSRSLSAPSTTTSSPGARPLLIAASPPCISATVTALISAVPSGLTT